ncbi:MAG: hypothetical protein IT577_22945 [Verrucomicrobiae bacterium]|nr:hypothetical protein [Verrucomicrobiae bacterium]
MLDWLESRLGRFAVPHSIRGIALLYLLCFILEALRPGFVGTLTLQPELVRQGQFWRLVTYAFIPSTFSPIWILFVVMIMWLIGDGIEEGFGAFKTNVYLLLGILGTATGAMCFGLPDISGQYLYLSLFFAFATLYPEYEILVFFILPVKVKWLALISAVLVALAFFGGGAAAKLAIGCAFANYLLFFGPTAARATVAMAEVRARRAKFEARKMPEDEPLHRCKTCGRTERDDDLLEFRVASDGEEYCTGHLPKLG